MKQQNERRPGYDPAAVREAMDAAVDRATQRLGTSKEELFRRANVRTNTLGKFLRGGTDSLSLSVTMAVAHACGISVSELVGETPPVEAAPPPVSDEEVVRALTESRRMMVALSATMEGGIAEMTRLLKQVQR